MPVTGEQFEIVAGGTRAVVTGVGAGLRSCTVDGADVVESFGADERPPMGAGQVLVPWPNRVADARFTWRGREYRLEVTEPGRGHANHGLLRRSEWTSTSCAIDSVTLAASIAASDGWPSALQVETTWTVTPGRLRATHVVANVGTAEVPVGIGAHPYLRVGDAPVADCALRVATETVADVDDRMIPTGVRPVAADEDLRTARTVGDLALDTCFGVAPGADGITAELSAPDGRAVRMVTDPAFGWIQAFTPASPFGDGTAVAVEPMTCPPDALNSGTDLHVLEPGGWWRVGWWLEASWGRERRGGRGSTPTGELDPGVENGGRR